MISVILPCRNEEDSLGKVISDIRRVMKGYSYEIIVSDSSTDASPKIAKKHGARVIKHDTKGYGIAYQEGVAASKGDILVMLDADDTYDAKDIPVMIKKIEAGADFVIGNRFGKKMGAGAMPFLHKYVGNPLLSFILRTFFQVPVRDAHCGLRAITKKAYDSLNLKTIGMEYASEMIVKAAKKNLRIEQFNTKYSTRKGQSKLNTFSDGWRHLKFMLLFSPLYLYTIPGLLLFILGGISMAILLATDPVVFGLTLHIHPLFVAGLITILGFQLLFFGLFAKTYYYLHFGQGEKLKQFYSVFTLEKALLAGVGLCIISFAIFVDILLRWIASDFGAIHNLEFVVFGFILFSLGIQTIFSSFMISLLEVE